MPQLGDMPQLSLGKNTGQKIHLNIFKNQHKITKKINLLDQGLCWNLSRRVWEKLQPHSGFAAKGERSLKRTPRKPRNLSKIPAQKFGLGKVWARFVKGSFFK